MASSAACGADSERTASRFFFVDVLIERAAEGAQTEFFAIVASFVGPATRVILRRVARRTRTRLGRARGTRALALAGTVRSAVGVGRSARGSVAVHHGARFDVARDAARVGDERPRRVVLHVGCSKGRDVRKAAELFGIVDRELDGPIMSGHHLQRAQRVGDRVLGKLLGQADEHGGTFVPQTDLYLAPRAHELQHDRAELLAQTGIAGLDRNRVPERARGEFFLAGGFAHFCLVQVQREPSLAVAGQHALHFEIRDGLAVATRSLQQLASCIDGIVALGIVLDRLAVVVERLARVAERRLCPEPAELLMDADDGGTQLRIRPHERRERARAAFEQCHESFRVTLFAVQRREAVRRDGVCRIALDRIHQRTRRLMRITEARHPDVCGFRIPVARERRLARLLSDALQQRCVYAWITLSRTVSLRDRHLVVWVVDQAPNQVLHFVLSFHSGGTLARRLDDLQREPQANK
jgi:hypothetical protein